MKMSDREYVVYLVQCNVRNVSDEDANAIAGRILLAKYAGGNSSVWHQAALHFAYPCQCAQCYKGPVQ
jgi:hypothetical protein